MTLDHIAVILLPSNAFITVLFRVIGRIAMPIFAFAVAEGCYYTRNKLRYLLSVFIIGAVCVTVQRIVTGRIYLNILITFSFSIAISFTLRYTLETKRVYAFLPFACAVLFSAFFNYCLGGLIGMRGLECDYGFWGTMLPVLVLFFKDFRLKLLALAVGITLIALQYGWLQWWAFLALIPIVLYDGTRGKLNIKYLFYLYYPFHFAVLYGIEMFL